MIQLHASREVVPPRDQMKKFGKKPFTLTVLFDYVETVEHHPYGSTTAAETGWDAQNEEFFVDAQQVSWAELEALFEGLDEDVDDVVQNLEEKAVAEFLGT